MPSLLRIHRLIDKLSGLPPLKPVLETRYDREFASNRNANLFRGVFDSYEAAQASAPETRPVGYDNDDAASMYMNRTRKIFPSDYPLLFWLEKLLANGTSWILAVISASAITLTGNISTIRPICAGPFMTFPPSWRAAASWRTATIRPGS